MWLNVASASLVPYSVRFDNPSLLYYLLLVSMCTCICVCDGSLCPSPANYLFANKGLVYVALTRDCRSLASGPAVLNRGSVLSLLFERPCSGGNAERYHLTLQLLIPVKQVVALFQIFLFFCDLIPDVRLAQWNAEKETGSETVIRFEIPVFSCCRYTNAPTHTDMLTWLWLQTLCTLHLSVAESLLSYLSGLFLWCSCMAWRRSSVYIMFFHFGLGFKGHLVVYCRYCKNVFCMRFMFLVLLKTSVTKQSIKVWCITFLWP